jgi:hypothetical protein
VAANSTARIELLHDGVGVREEGRREIQREGGVGVEVVPFDEIAHRADEDRLDPPPGVVELDRVRVCRADVSTLVEDALAHGIGADAGGFGAGCRRVLGRHRLFVDLGHGSRLHRRSRSAAPLGIGTLGLGNPGPGQLVRPLLADDDVALALVEQIFRFPQRLRPAPALLPAGAGGVEAARIFAGIGQRGIGRPVPRETAFWMSPPLCMPKALVSAPGHSA